MKTNKSFFIFALFSVGLLFAFNADAQTSPWKKKENSEYELLFKRLAFKGSNYLSQQQSKNAQERPTGPQSRLSSQVGFKNNGVQFVPQDSTATFWTGYNNIPQIAANYIAYFYYYAYPLNVVEDHRMTTSEKMVNQFISINSFLKTYGDSTNFVYLIDTSSSTFVPFSRIDMSLDANGNIGSQTVLNFDGTVYQNSYKEIFSYDGPEFITENIRQVWYNNVFNNSNKDIYSYDGQGNFTQTTSFNWDSGLNDWKNMYRTIISYNAQDLVEQVVYQEWIGSNWKDDSRSLVTYTSGSKTTIYEDWNGTQWVKEFKVTTTYDTQDKALMYTGWSWNGSNWAENVKSDFSYDGSGNLTTYTEQERVGSNWVNVNRYGYNYNSSNNVTKTLFQTYNAIANSFDTTKGVNYTYNSSNQITSFFEETWTGSTWNPNVDGNEKIIFNYKVSDDGTAIEHVLSANEFSFFPNPANDQLNLRMNNSKLITGISITDISGRVVYKNQSQLKASELSIPVNNLTDGVYFLQISSDGQKGAKSFVVKH